MLRQSTCTLVFLLEHERRILKGIVDDSQLSPKTRRRAQALLLTDRIEHPTTTDGAVADETGLCQGAILTLRKRYTISGLKKAISPLGHEEDRIELVTQLLASESAYFDHFAACRRGSSKSAMSTYRDIADSQPTQRGKALNA